MKKNSFIFITLLSVLFSSCSISNLAMKEPNHHIEFYKGDFVYSKQVSGQATSVRVFGIDWNRLFGSKSGSVESSTVKNDSKALGTSLSLGSSFVFEDAIAGVVSAVIPVLGDYGKDKVNSYALYEMMKNNPGYDVVIYPQYETKRFVIPLIYSKTTVKATARLGRIKD